MTTVRVELPPKLVPVFSGPARVRGAYGGRGSGKTRSFAKMAAVWAFKAAQEGREGIVLCARQFMNSLEDSSLEELKAAISSEDWLARQFDVGEKYIRTADGRISFSFVGLSRNLDSIKSKARIILAWVDEAEQVTESAWAKLMPTVREKGSEVWVTWNPEQEGSATDKRFRQSQADDIKVVEINWRDNPRFPAVLERERLADERDRPDDYAHVWEGDYRRAVDGAYWVKQLTAARAEGRTDSAPLDPLMTIRLFADIGGTGAKADSFVFWAAQFVGLQIRWIDYYEAQGQELASHVNWLRERGYTPDRAQIWLPHDGNTQDRVYNVSYASAFREAGYRVTVVPNQGRGAAKMRIEAARRLFPRMWFDGDCAHGLKRLAGYHEKKSSEGIPLGPAHDEASHAADAFGLGCITYEEPWTSVDEDEPESAGRSSVTGY